MGKGKGTFEFWSCRCVLPLGPSYFAIMPDLVLRANRAKMGRVILEIGGPNLRPEIAHSGASAWAAACGERERRY